MQNLDNTRNFIPVNIAVLTVSDSRTKENDKSGNYLVESIIGTGHVCEFKKIVKDNVKDILEVSINQGDDKADMTLSDEVKKIAFSIKYRDDCSADIEKLNMENGNLLREELINMIAIRLDNFGWKMILIINQSNFLKRIYHI